MAGRKSRGQNRAALLEAGYEAIAELGYAGATVAEILRRADVSSGTFFHYFPTKEALLLALLAEGEPDHRATSLEEIVDDYAREAADPHVPAFVREVSTLAHVPGVREALVDQAVRRRLRIERSLEPLGGVMRRDVPAEDVVTAIEVVLDGFESMAATREDLDIDHLARVVRQLVSETLGLDGLSDAAPR